MSHHQMSGAVARPDQLAGELLRTMLGARPQGHRAPRDEEIVQLRKDVARGRSIPWTLILRVILADLAEGVPLERVLATPRTLEAIILANAPVGAGDAPRPLSLLQQLEATLDGQLDEAQMLVAYDRSPFALRQLVERAGRLIALLEELVRAAEHELYAPAGRTPHQQVA